MPSLSKETIKNFKLEDITLLIKNYYYIRTKIKTVETKINKTKNYLNYKPIETIINLEAQVYAYEYLISNLANFFDLNNHNEILTTFKKWKNDPLNKESIIYNLVFTEIKNKLILNESISTLKLYLSYNELLQILQNKITKKDILSIITIRKKGFIFLNLQKYHNKIITNENTYQEIKSFFDNIIIKELNKSLDNNYIKGKPTYDFGTLNGEVLIYNSKLKQNILGKILVCEVLTASDTYKLLDAKAFVVDAGGILSHAAIFSREFNKPCLVGCKIATKYFKDGDKIQINSTNGICFKVNF